MIKTISGGCYYTLEDLNNCQVRDYLKEDSSLGSLSQAGLAICNYLKDNVTDSSTKELTEDLHDLTVIFTMMQDKALRIRILTKQLKDHLKIDIPE
jgi:hypothetical protein